ncbi:hypothetical protein [Rhizobium sp.]|uniref:hypothetical protein n=1 Tax=Rhizobium sp. TaxID=391 RepID=UPI0028B18BAE
MANGDAQYFKATLYFDNEPAISALTLTEAWGEEGYECEPLSEKGVFDGLRGSTKGFCWRARTGSSAGSTGPISGGRADQDRLVKDLLRRCESGI